MTLQNFWYAISHIPGDANKVADQLSRFPSGLLPLTMHAIRLSDFGVGPQQLRCGALGVVSSEAKQRMYFDQCHNDTMGHMSIYSTLRRLHDLGTHCPMR